MIKMFVRFDGLRTLNYPKILMLLWCQKASIVVVVCASRSICANAANIKEGPRSCAGQHHLQDQECCQAPPRARSLPGPGYWGGSSVYRGGENLGMEGPEDNGGEGQLGREPGYSGGDQFFPKENLCKLLFVTNFTFTFISESEIRPCTFWLCTVCNSMWPGPERWNM